jgi:hypothetical protein
VSCRVAQEYSSTDPKKTRSDLDGGFQEPVHTLNSSKDAEMPTSQPVAAAPVNFPPTGGPIGLQGTQTLVRATPSLPRVGPQPTTDTFSTPSHIRDTTPDALAPAPTPAAVLTRQETDVIPETPQSDHEAHQGAPTANLPFAPLVAERQKSFVIPEPQAEAPFAPGPSSPRKRSIPEDFEEPSTPTKKTRRSSNDNQKTAGGKPVTVRVGAMRGRQGSMSPARPRSPVRKPPVRTSSPSKATIAPRNSIWGEPLDDGFERKAAETAAKTKRATKPPA